MEKSHVEPFFISVVLFFQLSLCIVFTNAGHFFFYVFVVIPKFYLLAAPCQYCLCVSMCHDFAIIGRLELSLNTIHRLFVWDKHNHLKCFLRYLANAAGKTTCSPSCQELDFHIE